MPLSLEDRVSELERKNHKITTGIWALGFVGTILAAYGLVLQFNLDEAVRASDRATAAASQAIQEVSEARQELIVFTEDNKKLIEQVTSAALKAFDRDVEKRFESTYSVLADIETSRVPRLVQSAEARINEHTSSKKAEITKTVSTQLERFFGGPIRKSLAQWHTAETHGFLRLAVGGTGTATLRAWVNNEEEIKGAGNRAEATGTWGDLLIVRKGEKYRAEKLREDDGVAFLYWYPIGNQ